MADNAEPLADKAALKIEDAAFQAANTSVSVADAASEDIKNVAHQTGQSGVQVTKDVSVVIEEVARDATVRASSLPQHVRLWHCC